MSTTPTKCFGEKRKLRGTASAPAQSPSAIKRQRSSEEPSNENHKSEDSPPARNAHHRRTFLGRAPRSPDRHLSRISRPETMGGRDPGRRSSFENPCRLS